MLAENRGWETSLFSVSLLMFLVFISAEADGQPPSGPHPVAVPVSQTGASHGGTELSSAERLENAGYFDSAETILTAIINDLDAPKALRDQAKLELERILVTRRQLAELNLVDKYILDGRMDLDLASKRLADVVSKASSSQVIERAAQISSEEEPFLYWGPVNKILTWAKNILPYIVIIAVAYIIRGLFFCVYKGRGEKWVLAEMTDSTNRNARGVVAHYFSYWAQLRPRPVTSGLLVMEASLMPPIAPTVDADVGKFSVSQSLSSSDLTVWGVNLGSLWRAVTAILRWMLPQPLEIAGTVYFDSEKRICARLTAPLPKHNVNGSAGALPKTRPMVAVSAVGDDLSEAGLRRISEEVTYKMLYALTRNGDVDQAESANDLREGLQELKSYLLVSSPKDGPSPWSRLEKARETFEGVRKAHPEMLEAHIFEGIALDLLERHEDAASHFEHVERETVNASSSQTRELHEKAIYNGAVAYLRSLYSLEPIDEAIRRFKKLIRDDQQGPKNQAFPPEVESLKDKPLLVLALATLADAWANRTIQWRKIPPASDLPSIERLAEVIASHRDHVMGLTDLVQEVLDRVPASARAHASHGTSRGSAERSRNKWDADIFRQVQWARSNALGDFYLYAAVEIRKLVVEQPLAGQTTIYKDLKVEELIDNALTELRKCEMLLPAGVETLSNMGTLYLARGMGGDLPLARQYIQRAIALNPHYEYAYYRLAQSWEQEQWRERVIETLKSWPLPPQIPSFRNMFIKYFVEPKLEYPTDLNK
jgi:tetratricopeptide (TPR) repeat protein